MYATTAKMMNGVNGVHTSPKIVIEVEGQAEWTTRTPTKTRKNKNGPMYHNKVGGYHNNTLDIHVATTSLCALPKVVGNIQDSQK